MACVARHDWDIRILCPGSFHSLAGIMKQRSNCRHIHTDTVDYGFAARDSQSRSDGDLCSGMCSSTNIYATISLNVTSKIIFATILERIFFHTIPSVLSIMGTLIIMGSAVYVAVRFFLLCRQIGPSLTGLLFSYRVADETIDAK